MPVAATAASRAGSYTFAGIPAAVATTGILTTSVTGSPPSGAIPGPGEDLVVFIIPEYGGLYDADDTPGISHLPAREASLTSGAVHRRRPVVAYEKLQLWFP
jgi:hypothetical protein